MSRASHQYSHLLRVALAAAALAMLFAMASAQPGSLPPRTGPGGGPPRAQLPDVGKREGFVFAKSKEYPGTYEVFTDDGRVLHVSESFMKLTVRSPQLPADKYLMVLENYPKMIESQYEIIMSKYYPDSTEETQDFEDVTVGPHQGQTIHVSQDPDAGPYVRVRVEGADGQVQEYSVSKSAVNDILNNPKLGVDQKIRALNKIPFPLPEEARDNFDQLDRDALLQAASELPNVKKQEFIKMRKVFRETEERLAKGDKPQPPKPDVWPTEAPLPKYTGPKGASGDSKGAIRISPISQRDGASAEKTDAAQDLAKTGGMSENFGLILVIVVVVIALALVAVRLFLYLRE